jgi:hypothetical protein
MPASTVYKMQDVVDSGSHPDQRRQGCERQRCRLPQPRRHAPRLRERRRPALAAEAAGSLLRAVRGRCRRLGGSATSFRSPTSISRRFSTTSWRARRPRTTNRSTKAARLAFFKLFGEQIAGGADGEDLGEVVRRSHAGCAGVGSDVAKNAIRNAAIEFCDRSWVWRVDHNPIDALLNTAPTPTRRRPTPRSRCRSRSGSTGSSSRIRTHEIESPLPNWPSMVGPGRLLRSGAARDADRRAGAERGSPAPSSSRWR